MPRKKKGYQGKSDKDYSEQRPAMSYPGIRKTKRTSLGTPKKATQYSARKNRSYRYVGSKRGVVAAAKRKKNK